MHTLKTEWARISAGDFSRCPWCAFATGLYATLIYWSIQSLHRLGLSWASSVLLLIPLSVGWMILLFIAMVFIMGRVRAGPKTTFDGLSKEWRR